jgi:hypothetical protein
MGRHAHRSSSLAKVGLIGLTSNLPDEGQDTSTLRRHRRDGRVRRAPIDAGAARFRLEGDQGFGID